MNLKKTNESNFKERRTLISHGVCGALCCGSKTMLIFGWFCGTAGRIIGRAPFIGRTGRMVMPGRSVGRIMGLGAPGRIIGRTLPGRTVGRMEGLTGRTFTGILGTPPLLMVAPRMTGPPRPPTWERTVRRGSVLWGPYMNGSPPGHPHRSGGGPHDPASPHRPASRHGGGSTDVDGTPD